MAVRRPSVAFSIVVRAEYANQIGMLGKITTAIGSAGGDIGRIDLVTPVGKNIARDITINTRDVPHSQEIVEKIRAISGVRVVNVVDQVFHYHLGGKIEMRGKLPVKTMDDMSIAYSPGVARVSTAVGDDPEAAWEFTGKGNTVAVVSDGTAVLGLGDIGPYGAMPVMEGKSLLFKELAGINAWPICLATKDPDEIIKTVKYLSVGFGGINLEDISAPRCFYIEDRLKEECDIPVFHDDQHGAAAVVLAGILNALKVVGKKLNEVQVVLVGCGAAGTAVSKLLTKAGVTDLIGVDKQGVLHKDGSYGTHPGWRWFAENTNPRNIKGTLKDAIKGADVFIGTSGPNVLSVDLIKLMAKDRIVFALANPVPEIWPEDAQDHVRIMATGRSDYPNQVNNSLCFPGLFRGVLDVRAKEINDTMKLAAARAIASVVKEQELNENYIIPNVFHPDVVPLVAQEVGRAARETGVARRVK